MKDDANGAAKPKLLAGKGTRMPVNSVALAKLAEFFTQAAAIYAEAESPVEFMKAITELTDGQSTTEYKRGRNEYKAANRWIALDNGEIGGELRVTFSLNNHDQFTVDFRQWYQP
jgi:hypothetical protein